MRSSPGKALTSIAAMSAMIVAAMLAPFGNAGANTIVKFSGVIDSISTGYEIPGIFVGDEVSGVLTFNPATVDTQPIEWIGAYPGAISSFKVTIGSKVFSMTTSGSPAGEIDVINDDNIFSTYHDDMLFRVAVEEATDPGLVRFFQLTFGTSAATPPTLLSSDALLENPDLNAFDIRRGFITYMPPGASAGNNFLLTSVEVIPVREPRDLTGDGKADIVIRNMDSGYLFMWQMVGNLKTYLGISPLALTREVVAIADLTGDRKADILLRNKDNGYVYMWQMDGNLKTYAGISSLGLNKDVVGVGDLTGDGTADVVLRNRDTGYIFMWEMDSGVAVYRGISSLAANKEIVGIGDLTGDGKADIVLRNKDNGYVFMWQMDGSAKTYLGISSLALSREVVGVGDLTGDGKADIVLRNKDNNYLYMWAMDGNLKTYYGIGSLGPDRKLVQISDLDGDGVSDLVLRSTATGNMELWEIDGGLVTAKTIGPLALSREVQPSAVPPPPPSVEAFDDSASTFSDKAVTISVLANDKPDPTALSITSITQPANGVVVNNGNGTLSYSQNGLAKESIGMGLYKTHCMSCHNVRGFSGTDTFSYVASDGRTSASANVSVTVTTFDLAGASGNLSGLSVSKCTDLPHKCYVPGDAEIQAIGRFLSEVFAP